MFLPFDDIGEITPRGEGRRGRRLPFYPMYIELEARLLSFQSMSFDGPDMTDLARAGFFGKLSYCVSLQWWIQNFL